MAVQMVKENKSLTPTQLSALKALGLSTADIEKQLAKVAADAVRQDLAGDLQVAVEKILTAQPVKPSSKDTSSWVGSIFGGITVEVDGRPYAVQVSIKDVAASKARSSK